MFSRIKVAIVHDWLTGMRGGEKVLEVLCELFPSAPIYTLLHNKGSISKTIESHEIHTSFVNYLPLKATGYRNYLPFFPKAIEAFDLSKYDVVLSTSHCVAKGAKSRKNAIHICYCHTPMRYVWELYDDYFGRGRIGIAKRMSMFLIVKYLRRWDVRTCDHIHYFIANSYNVAKRIQKHYGRSADVIQPPVDGSRFPLSSVDDGYYLIVSALVPYKRIDLAIETFRHRRERLLIVGSGPEYRSLVAKAPPNVEFLGWRSDEELISYYSKCHALIFPGMEDFGIVPLEAMACGKPVIAFGAGGALETIIENGPHATGIFFYEQTLHAISDAIERANERNYHPAAIRAHALCFDRQHFKNKIHKYVEERIALSRGGDNLNS